MDFEINIPVVQTTVEPGDYWPEGQAGLLYCGKCHTPKQARVVMLGKPRTVPCLCDCKAAKMEKEKAERKAAQKAEAMRRARKEAFEDGKMQGWTFDVDDRKNQKASDVALRYCAEFETFRKNGRGLILYGGTGTGKTFLACCIANLLIDKGYTVLVKNFSTISNELLSTWDKGEYMDRLNGVGLLVLDDFSIERGTEYMRETVYNVIDGRYKAGRPVIVTTNLTAEQLKAPASIEEKRIYSRLMEMCVPVPVNGKDRRYDGAAAAYARDMQLLGL